jgi:hypothetical protein
LISNLTIILHPMKISIRLSLLLASFSLFIQLLQAQQTITTTGANAVGTGGTISYTIGQVAYIIISGTNGSVVQGVQQPFEISVVTSADYRPMIDLLVLVYPNPTDSYLKMITEIDDYTGISYRLCDINGVTLQEKNITGRETGINMGNLSSSIYFLKISKDGSDIKVFKIIKK